MRTAATVTEIAADLPRWAEELGLQQLGIADLTLNQAEQRLHQWIAQGYHGEMDYMVKHGSKRSRPAELLPGTMRVISVRMDYLSRDRASCITQLNMPHRGYVSVYALGRDYHKVLRQRLKRLAQRIEQAIGRSHQWRVFTDSAPVLEKPLAAKAGLGWIGKHTNLIERQSGSFFFLGEIYTDLPLPVTQSEPHDHCGRCQACLEVCPTGAIIAPYQLDARLCISYLTIELHGDIPLALRPSIGNRVYGCDDCQLICPWNRFAQRSPEVDFLPRHNLDNSRLVDLFLWSEADFLRATEGSAIRRLGYHRWLRNVAVALGNAATSTTQQAALQQRLNFPSDLVQRHVQWALHRQSAV